MVVKTKSRPGMTAAEVEALHKPPDGADQKPAIDKAALNAARAARDTAVQQTSAAASPAPKLPIHVPPKNIVDVDVSTYPDEWVLTKLKDGRVCAFGPPNKATRLITESMFKGSEVEGAQLEKQEENAIVLNYLRALNGRILPGAIWTYPEIVNLMDELGDLGVRMAFEVFNYHFGYGGGRYFDLLKKSVPTEDTSNESA